MIYDYLSYEYEADIFANQMKYVKKLKPIKVFMTNIESENHDQLIIRNLVESYGLTIGMRQLPCVVSAVSMLEEIYTKYRILAII